MSEGAGTRSQRFFARWYPDVMQRAEDAGQAEIRARHLARARGRVLDLGTGNGFSVPHYTAEVTELVMLEPNPALRAQLQRRTADIRARAWQIVDGDAYALPFADASFDTVAASLVFCSLDRPAAALAELARVLRPGGTFLFHEHVRGTGLRRVVQEVATPVQRRIADGCRPNRDFVGLLRRSPFTVADVDELRMPAGALTVVPMVVGAATTARP
ncbi:methyltransferase domain-containing protein [Pimelobacter simplex]|uniref:Methyltransferase type 11 n=1 Tax=Nocardioides simplex TaxID=2045 RepID=A0A0A1DIF3_NOCSI|nr:class I SAM-dependent methyltransferase [Pimelobacter simplex]AIY16422.1 Methyltransferase type 11 [Pimelobacter simplex]MCG8152900.1 methyltransferase domain-containing protein [Pimelobacter simplex]GEB11869.1 type 11 methyltransferase [Pimelobacter simplex]SFN02834.1 Methyltransferase domain-containing protein [Pimelobacter simplex]